MKKIIWSNRLDLKDFQDYFKEEGITDESEQYEAMYELNNIYLEDELMNLDCELPGNILVIADLGLWNGRRAGYKEMGNNLNNVLKTFCGEYCEVYYDGHNIVASDSHHDGTNYYEFRLIRDDKNIDVLKDKIYNDDFSRTDINNYTRSLAPFVKEIYGW
jgi:hypothetical protein